MKLYSYKTLDSTHSEAFRMLEKMPKESEIKPFIVIAETQTNGMGRFDRKWASPEKGNLYMSVAINSEHPLEIMPLICACAIKKSLENINGEVLIKWPNDIMLNKLKCAGILTTRIDNIYVIGIGINIVTSNNIPHATHIQLCNPEYNTEPQDLAHIIYNNLIHYIEIAKNSKQSIIDLWLTNAYKLNQSVTVKMQNKEDINGTFVGLDNDGSIILDVEGKKQIITYGDVS